MKTILFILVILIVVESFIIIAAWLAQTEGHSFTRNLVAAHILGYSLIIACVGSMAIDYFILEKFFK